MTLSCCVCREVGDISTVEWEWQIMLTSLSLNSTNIVFTISPWCFNLSSLSSAKFNLSFCNSLDLYWQYIYKNIPCLFFWCNFFENNICVLLLHLINEREWTNKSNYPNSIIYGLCVLRPEDNAYLNFSLCTKYFSGLTIKIFSIVI